VDGQSPDYAMGKFLKTGKVVIVLQGRYAGRKAVILKNSDESSDKTWPYGHCVVAGIDRYPLKVQKNQGPKTIKKRTAIKPFMKVINHNHIMPTRYGLENVESLKSIPCDNAVLKNPNARKESRKKIKEQFQERLTAGKNRWFFSKLRF
jgi:large subunit ribosomal protein L27e